MKMEGMSHDALEADIRELADATRERTSGDITKESLEETIREKVYGPDPRISPNEADRVQMNATPNAVKPSPLPSYASTVDPQSRLRAEELLDLAWHKGLRAAVKDVKKESPIVMDLFHDAITERMYDEFKKRGILK